MRKEAEREKSRRAGKKRATGKLSRINWEARKVQARAVRVARVE